ncbi:MAG: hypothetical protein DRI39_07855 [Chloroflexi bacterium]|nr:MAG: hypothetical protein DRI39_07855 [Chloroflexota bacterium]
MRGHRAAIPLAAVVVIALALRMVGIDFGLPMLDHPDEPLLVSRADVMARTNDFNPHFFHYPSFLIYTLMVLFKFEYFLESLGVLDVSRSTLYLSSRVLVAVLGTAMILIVYLIGCKLYGKKIGILSAVFLAVMPMAVRDSHYATVDVPMTFLTTVAFFFIVSLAKSGRLRHGLIAGAFVGLAASTKQSGGLLLLPLFTAFVLAHVYHDPRLANLRSSSLAIARGFVCSSAAAVLLFVVTSPFAVLDHQTFLNDLRFEMDHMATGHGVVFLGTAPGWIHHATDSLRSALTPYLEVASLLGVVSLVAVGAYRLLAPNWRNHRQEVAAAFLLLSWILPYYLIIGSWEVKFERYVIPLLPFLAITASYAVVRSSELLRGPLARLCPTPGGAASVVLCIIIATALVVPPLQSSWRVSGDLAKETTQQVALDWIQENIPEGSLIVREMYTPETELLGEYETAYYGYRLASADMSEIEKADYVIISSTMYGRFYAHPEQAAEEIQCYDTLAEAFTLEKVICSSETVVGPELRIYRVR